MLPRGRLDIGWADLLYGLGCCLRPGDPVQAQQRVERLWSPAADSLACLSIRSGFDLVLKCLELPPGSEVLVSAVTIRDMPRIVAQHGLTPVPVDVCLPALTLDLEGLARAVTPRSRAILVAHLFGSRMPLDAVAAFARDHGLLLIEDCAQAYAGDGYRGHPGSDVTMFSFGPVKTSTALGGALLRFRDRALLAKARAVQACYPRQDPRQFVRRLLTYAVLKALTAALFFDAFRAACRLQGRTHDEAISAATRGFAGPGFFGNIRRQPSAPLLSLLARRLRTYDPARIERRARAAQEAIRRMPGVRRPGPEAACHTYWIFPIQSSAPEALMRHLWARGFDATRGASSLHAVEAPAGRSDLAPAQARALMEQILYLPVYAGVPDAALQRLAAGVLEFDHG